MGKQREAREMTEPVDSKREDKAEMATMPSLYGKTKKRKTKVVDLTPKRKAGK